MMGVDSSVTARVIASLLGHPRAGASVIEVSHARGIVALTGAVESDEVREALEGIARRQEGVRDVVNHLRVVPRRWARRQLMLRTRGSPFHLNKGRSKRFD
jgi:osmotically-inducible protein OsmY